MLEEFESDRCSFSILKPRMRRKCFLGEDEGDASGSEKAEYDGVVGGEKDIEFLPSDFP